MTMYVRVWSVCWAVIACTLLGCSGGGTELPHGGVDQTHPTVIPDASRPANDGGRLTCAPDEVQDCVIDRGTFMGIHDCAKGKQACGDAGQWAACVEL